MVKSPVTVVLQGLLKIKLDVAVIAQLVEHRTLKREIRVRIPPDAAHASMSFSEFICIDIHLSLAYGEGKHREENLLGRIPQTDDGQQRLRCEAPSNCDHQPACQAW